MAPSYWNHVRLGDVCSKIGSGATPRGGSDVYLAKGPYALIRSQNVYNDGLHRAGLAFIGAKHAAELQNVELLQDDVLLNITGDSVARACLVDRALLPARVNQHVAIIRTDPRNLNPRFLWYALVSPQMQRSLLSLAGAGGTRNALTKGMIESVEVRIPPLPNQLAIAHILGALDEKIELNRRMNETREAIARALFQSWFVDFDAVRAKANGRDPGLPPTIAELFPNRFEESELGEVPSGWRVGTFGDVADNPRRGIQASDIDATMPYIALEHMPRRSISLGEWGVADGLQSNKFEFKRGEILFGKLRPYFHKVGVAPLDGVCSTDIVVVTPKTGKWFGYVLGQASSTTFVAYTNAGSTGTKMPRTNWSDMARYAIVLPPERVARAFTSQVQPMIDRMIIAIHESRTLTALRETLLPKLISGQLRVKDAERFLARAGV